jgi:phosphatidyl-myo-inositol alpha-mannosyltransferase
MAGCDRTLHSRNKPTRAGGVYTAEEQLGSIGRRVSRSSIAVAALLLCVLGAAVATPQLLGTRVASALGTLERADPRYLWLAAAGCALTVVGSAGSWRTAIGLCGGETTLGDATARFGVGSLVNTFIPARAGDAVRIGLFSRLVPSDHPLWTTGGAFAALGAARAVVLGALVLAGALVGAVPLWPLLVAALVAAAAIVAAARARRSRAHLLDAFRALAAEPRAAVRLVAWAAMSVAGRLAAAAAVSAALGIGDPFRAALVILPALDLTGIVPLTPGNLGVASGAIAVAVHTHGVPFNSGLAAGITFQAVETGVGLVIGVAGVLRLATVPKVRIPVPSEG